MLNQADFDLVIKGVDVEQGLITGIASTPAPDRQGDIIDLEGATFADEIPLLLHHDRQRPVGIARLTRTKDAIHFVAQLAQVNEPGPLRDRISETAQSVKAGLLKGASVGIRPLRDGVKAIKTGLHILKGEIVELSLVTVPANAAATVLSYKSADALPPVEKKPMTTSEQIVALSTKRAANVARMNALMDADGPLSDLQTKEYDGLDAEVADIDVRLPRLQKLEQAMLAAAQPVTSTTLTLPTGRATVTTPSYRVKPNVEPGTAFVRYCKAMAAGGGNRFEAIDYAANLQTWRDQTPEVELLLRAASNPATTTNAPWAGALVPTVTHLGSEFMELVRAKTLIDRIRGLRRVPFDSQVPAQTGGGTYKWVGEGGQKPVGQLAFTTKAVGHHKISGILTFTLELARNSSPDAETTFRNEMVAGIAGFKNAQFIDPAVAAVAGVKPASITNGDTPITATTNPLVDIAALLQTFITAGLGLEGVTLLMSETNAFVLSNRRSAMGVADFPNVSIAGGTVAGVPVVTSNACGTNIIGVLPPYILYAEDPGVSIDVSTQASVQMLDNPAAPDATSVFRSFWQENLIGLRAEQFVSWTKGHANAVAMKIG